MNKSEINAAIALLKKLAGNEAKPVKGRKGGKMTREKLSAMTVAAFEKAGFKDNRPHVTIKHHGGWRADGLMVRHGQSGIQVGPYTLFHVSQTQPAAEYEAEKAKRQSQSPKASEVTEAMIAAYLEKKAAEAALKSEYGM
jgi:hypothetical protein